MKICISPDLEYTEVWDGVFYKKLSHYPTVSQWEIKTVLDFIAYETRYGRECPIECGDDKLREYLLSELKQPEKYRNVQRPGLLTECTACPVRKGCETKYVCHTTSLENAISILQCGSLLSPVKVRGIPANVLAQESRNAAKDPEDYFEYIMLAWGNCQAGDRLVMERKLGRFPTQTDLSRDFTPGIRFYFRYDSLVNHPQRVFDGALPLKIKDEIVLDRWLDALVIPEACREAIMPHISAELLNRAVFVEQDGEDIWEWSEKVYTRIEKR